MTPGTSTSTPTPPAAAGGDDLDAAGEQARVADTPPPAPDRVKIGAAWYRVLFDAAEVAAASASADLDDGSAWAAFSDHRKQIIGIDPTSHPDQQRISLVHEVLHCCLRLSGVYPNHYARIVHKAGRDYDIGVEEFTVASTAGPLLSVLRENPQLLTWLTFEGIYTEVPETS